MANSDRSAANSSPAAAVREPPTLLIASAIATLVLAAIFFLAESISAGRLARDQVRSSALISEALTDALNAGIDAETGQRGYLLTREQSYLDPYTEGVVNWPAELDRLRELVAADGQPGQLEQVDQLRQPSEEKLAEMDAVLEFAEAGNGLALLELIQSNLGKQLMDAYRSDTRELRAEQGRLIEDSLSRAQTIESRNLALLAALAGLILVLFAILFWLQRKAARAAIAESETLAMRRARDQSELVSRELSHRVKNLFAVIISMVRMAGRQNAEPQTAFNSLRDRIHALSLAHSVSLGDINNPVASIEDLLRATLAPYDPQAGQISLGGEHVLIPASSITPVGLIFHELATNAVKYGALKTEAGKLDVEWTTFKRDGKPFIRLAWSEGGLSGIRQVETEGFGATMITASAQQIGGDIKRDWRGDGLQVVLEFPAQEND